MNDNSMTEQVARLIGNLLAGGGTVFLPGIGTLYVERQAARRIDRRHVVPPCRVVQFSSQERGVSFVEEIARVLKVNGVQPENPLPEAQKVFDRWIARVREGDTLTIAGIGVLRFKDFRIDPEFDRRLNPQGHEPVRVQAPRRFDAVLWIGVAVIVCVLGGTAWWWFGWKESGSGPKTVTVAERTATQHPEGSEESFPADASTATANAGTGIPGQEEPRTLNSSESESVAVSGDATGIRSAVGTSGTDAEKDSSSDFGPSKLISRHHYVVMGVFSTMENAERAVRDAASKDVAMNCGIYRFGAKFMVSPFESDDPEACRLFIRAHAERFPGMWTYTAR